MNLYNYKALKDRTKTVTGKIEAETTLEARKKVKAMGLVPISVEEVVDKTKKVSTKPVKISSLSLREKIDFTSTLEILENFSFALLYMNFAINSELGLSFLNSTNSIKSL